MANLKDIRNRISSVKNTQQITKAMKMVAAAKLRKAQQRMLDTRPYAKKLRETIFNLSESSPDNPFMEQREKVENVLLIIVGSDRGLCGGFNNNLFKEVNKHIENNLSEYRDDSRLKLICIGRKANEHYKKQGYDLLGNYVGFFDEIKFENVAAIMKQARHMFISGEVDRVEVAYNEFKSVVAQNRIIDTVMPIRPANQQDDEEQENSVVMSDYIFEPDAKTILDNIIPQYINMRLWQAILESNASEQGARMAAMDNATENAKEMLDDLKLKYNQARQAAITTEISEIVSGAESLKDN